MIVSWSSLLGSGNYPLFSEYRALLARLLAQHGSIGEVSPDSGVTAQWPRVPILAGLGIAVEWLSKINVTIQRKPGSGLDSYLTPGNSMFWPVWYREVAGKSPISLDHKWLSGGLNTEIQWKALVGARDQNWYNSLHALASYMSAVDKNVGIVQNGYVTPRFLQRLGDAVLQLEHWNRTVRGKASGQSLGESETRAGTAGLFDIVSSSIKDAPRVFGEGIGAVAGAAGNAAGEAVGGALDGLLRNLRLPGLILASGLAAYVLYRYR